MRLPQSRAGWQGLYLRSLDYLGRTSEVKVRKTPKKVKCDGWTDGRTNGPKKRGVESRSTRLKKVVGYQLFLGSDRKIKTYGQGQCLRSFFGHWGRAVIKKRILKSGGTNKQIE